MIRTSPLRRDVVRRYGVILAYTGLLWALTGLLLLAPLAGLPFFPEEAALTPHFLVPAGGLLAAGLGLWLPFHGRMSHALDIAEGGVIVVLGWAGACIGAAWPFVGILGLGPTQALFESVSGLTTTGLSVVDVTTAPRLVLLWRSIMQCTGGAGLAIIMLAAVTGPAGTGLPGAEGRTDQLLPHVRKSAALVVTIYCGYAAAATLAYALAGMSWFDALNHAFTVISTGGFSTRPESIGAWDSPVVEGVTVVFMILGSLNFLTAHLLLTGRLRAVWRNSELRFAIVSILLGGLCVLLFVVGDLYAPWTRALRVALFEVASAATTTGFNTVGYSAWNALGLHILILLMLVGGGSGSTAGGLKQYRAVLMLNAVIWEIRRRARPRGALQPLTISHGRNTEYMDTPRIAETGIFLVFYLTLWALGVCVLAAHGYPLRDCLFEFASALGTVGLSVGITGAGAPTGVLWVETAGMFLGRLEMFVVFVALFKVARDAPRIVRALAEH